MGKIKTPPFTKDQVKECLSIEKYKTIKEIAKELAFKLRKRYSHITGEFINAVTALLFSLTTYNLARSCKNKDGENLFALA